MVVRARSKIDEGVWHYQWTRTEYEKAIDMGIFHPEARLELLDGEIIEMAAQDSLHSTGIQLVQDTLLCTSCQDGTLCVCNCPLPSMMGQSLNQILP